MTNLTSLEELLQFLPLLLPLLVAELALFGYALWHILTHKTYKRGSRALWLVLIIVLMNFIGPILYLVLGKEDA